MSEELDMTKKYQEHYNQLLSGTISDVIIKSISYQANIKLANDVIADNENKIKELQDKLEKTNQELESCKSNKNISENQKIASLEKSLKDSSETISRLNSNINELNRYKSEYESVKTQVHHIDTFRNELEKSRQQIIQQKNEYENKIEDLGKKHKAEIETLNKKIDYLQLTPAKRKKLESSLVVTTETKVEETKPETKAKIIKQNIPEVVVKKDGGSF